MTVPCFDPYSGSLDAAQVAAGVDAARQNAARLLVDAELLLGARRYPTAASLAIPVIEEARKVSILRRIAMCRDESERGKFWHEYRSDRGKRRHWVLPNVCVEGRPDKDLALDGRCEDSGTIVSLKRLGFHTDCLAGAYWSRPESAIGEQLAEQFVGLARLASAVAGQLGGAAYSAISHAEPRLGETP